MSEVTSRARIGRGRVGLVGRVPVLHRLGGERIAEAGTAERAAEQFAGPERHRVLAVERGSPLDRDHIGDQRLAVESELREDRAPQALDLGGDFRRISDI